jgi:Polysaccharide deacetylase
VRIGIVYSETSANLAYSTDIYNKLFMEAESEAMAAGIPFDILTEADLTDINKVKQYDSLVFPSFQAAASDKIAAIQSTLTTASQTYHIGMIAQGDFLTTDEKGQTFSYDRMKAILGIDKAGGSSDAIFNVVADAGHPVMQGYAQDETLGSYHLAYTNYQAVSGTATSLADIVVNGQRVPGIIATQTNGRNVHFATDGMLGDNNVLSQAIRWSVLGDQPGVTLEMSRQSSIVAPRIDMDNSQYVNLVAPVDANGQPLPGIYDKMLPIIEQWKKDFNFAGSFYVNIGNDPANGATTNWAVSGPLYQQLLALGNEIGTHSYTHPMNTDSLTPAQIQFEFQASKQVIEQQLGIQVNGAAVPGDPETTATARDIGQYFHYLSGGTVGLGAGYLNALGYMTPSDQNLVYIAQNVASDFNQIGFYGKSAQQAEDFWTQEWTSITSHSPMPVAVWGIHDYGITEQSSSDGGPSLYSTQMYTDFWQMAYNANAEFVTLDDLSQRISAEQKAHITTQMVGNTITATVTPDPSAPDLGKFALNLDNGNGQVIKSVQNWYAYDQDKVFVPKDGGQFVITLGPTQDDVTHIDKLPSRADLLTVSGDGQSLNFQIDGQGEVDVHLKSPSSKQVAVIGNLDAVLRGSEMEVTFGTAGQHAVSIVDGGIVPVASDGVIYYLDSQDQEYAKLFHLSDGTGRIEFQDTTGGAEWSDYTSYTDAQNAQVAQTVNQRDGSGWTQFWDVSGKDSWSDFASYLDTQDRLYAQTVHERDGSGWTEFWNVSNQGAWSEFASYIDAQGRLYSTTTINQDGSKVVFYKDVDNAYDWATYTQVQDATGKIISYYGTNHDGSTWVAV